MFETSQKRAPRFTVEEHALRLDAVRAGMAAFGVEALIVSDPANLAWITGYDGGASDAPQAAIVTHDAPPRWWGAEADLGAAAATTWMDSGQLIAAPGPDGRHPFEALAGALEFWGLGKANIGVELDSGGFTGAVMGVLLSSLPNAAYLDATGLVDLRRLVKSGAEIAAMRAAAAAADAAMEAAIAAAEIGVAPATIAADAARALSALGAPAAAPSVLTGVEAGFRRLPASHAPLDAETPIAFDFTGAVGRYQCPIARCLFLGDPPVRLVDAATRAADAFDAALSVATPGAPVSALARAFADGLGAPDAATRRIGFSVGLAVAPRIHERNISVAGAQEAELIEGMILHLFAGAPELGAPLRFAETFLIGPSGAEPLARAPRELAVKG